MKATLQRRKTPMKFIMIMKPTLTQLTQLRILLLLSMKTSMVMIIMMMRGIMMMRRIMKMKKVMTRGVVFIRLMKKKHEFKSTEYLVYYTYIKR